MRAVMYGAGNIGRGFIGQLFAASNYELTFIDVAEDIVDAINSERRYPVRVLENDGIKNRYADQWVEGVSAVNGNDTEKAAQAIAGCDIMATAVGVRVLPLIAPVIASGIKKRFAQNETPLNIIICENLIDADKVLEKLLCGCLGHDEQKLFAERIGLVEASIGRMVPVQTPLMRDGNKLRVCVEAYNYLPVDKDAFKGAVPQIKNMVPFSRFDFYIKRKLYIHNMGHAVCAYLGMLKGDTFIYEAMRRGDIRFIAQNAMNESALALSKEYDMPLGDLYWHIRDLLRRFSNSALGDTCARVGGDTVRKLSAADRLIGAVTCCAAQGITPAFISIGAAAALRCHLDGQHKAQNSEEASAVLRETSGMDISGDAAKRILLFYDMIIKGNELSEAALAALALGNKTGII